ncbi:molybdenum cofactor guanylyltransferase [Desulfuromonas versatilis]|uniref:Multifunctional fusion protein n=1 Tax=Desulfuromonas versatilis TaxID=2802975 RepID=A0ABN6E1C8_9BACT|nr:formate dehydrogenase accessory sulfurtransferase FdhD [Desulfuromonas versatilis]BCR05634.1 molybdenum cofactor guanylyltransferase [Desulfuromonas versatilis]
MDHSGNRTVYQFKNGRLASHGRQVVQEYPLQLTVNDRELATLVASPHQLNFLVAGFLRNQGFISGLDEIQTLGVCREFGAARVRIRGEVPERLKPTLTSGCGTGITFNFEPAAAPDAAAVREQPRFSPASVFELMKGLAQRAEQYRSHGGIHSAAVGDGRQLLLYAEDLGRHNTLDRLAGEALFKNIDLRGKMLVTSGRVSTEMAAKAAKLGIALIASRTSPTDLAVQMCEQAGITLVGYLRGESFELYCRPEGLELAPTAKKIPGVTGVILAGGESRRMGCDKSLLPIDGARFIEHIHRVMAGLFDEVLLVTNSPGLYEGIDCRKVPDIYFAQGSLAGIHSGLCHARNAKAFVVACDMPFVSAEVVREICSHGEGGEVVIPRGAEGLEPLHALYDKSCLPAMEAVLDRGQRRIVSFFPQVQVRELGPENLAAHDPQGRTFLNINTPQEYFALRGGKEDGPLPEARANRA